MQVEGEQRKSHYMLYIIHSRQTYAGGRHGHLKASQFVLTELEKHIFLCRLNASRTDQTALWSITQRTFEPVNATRRLHIWQGTTEGMKEQYKSTRRRYKEEDAYLCEHMLTHSQSLSLLVKPIHTLTKTPGANLPPYQPTAVTDLVTFS